MAPSRLFATCSIRCALVVAAIGAIAHPHSVSAQLTPARLIGRSVAQPDDAKYEDVAGAITLFLDADFEGARKLLQDAAKKQPELGPADVLFAHLLIAAGSAPNGRAALERAVIEEPTDPEAYLLFGELALRESRVTDAELLLRKAGELCQKYDRNALRKKNVQVGALAGLVSVAEARGRWDEAERLARSWLVADAASVPAHISLGRAQFHLKNYKDAYATFQEAFKLDSTAPRPEINMALLYEEQAQRGDVAKRESARKAMETAVERDPGGLFTRLTVARWALEACLIDVAQVNVQAAQKIDPKSLEVKLLAGLVARHQKDYAAAEGAFLAAHLQAPANLVAANQLALVLVEQTSKEKQQLAISYAELNAQANADRNLPGGREAAVTLAWVLFRVGRQAEGLRLMQSAVNAGPISDESAYCAARVLSESGAVEAAMRLLEPVVAKGRCFPLRAEAEALFAKLTKPAKPAPPKEQK